MVNKISPVHSGFKDKMYELFKKIEFSQHIFFLWEKMEELEDKGFGPEPSIHSKGAIKFQKEILKANEWVLETLENGLSLGEGARFPEKYWEKNNKSALENMERLREKFLIYEKEGKVERLKEKPRICSPLSVVEKGYGENRKFRPVLDQSRCVNKFLSKEGTKLNDLAFFEPFFEENAYMCSYDLQSMYHQLRLNEKTKELFGCSILDENGEEIFFRFCVLAFGNSRAVFTMTKLLGTAQDFFRHNGINTGVFIDDGLLVHKDKAVLRVQNLFVHKVLTMAGWVINQEKTLIEPTQKLVYQGFGIDLARMEYSLTEEKRSHIIREIETLKERVKNQESIPAKEIAGVLGKVVSVKKSHGPGVQIGLRHCQHVLGLAVCPSHDIEQPEWNVNVKLDRQSEKELEYVQSLLVKSNAYPIPVQKEVQIYESSGVSFRVTETHRHQETHSVFISDASDKVAFVFEAEKFRMVEEFGFDQEEMSMGSGHRELQAVIKTLEKHKEKIAIDRTVIYWVSDSKNVYHFLKKGSRKKDIQRTVLRIKEWERQLGIRIVPIWKPRTVSDIALADLGSKMYKSTDEWGINMALFKKIQRYVGEKVTIDGFATSANKRVPRFFSIYPQIGMLGMDFFAQELTSGEVYWLNPPVKMVAKCIKKVLGAKSEVLAYISFPEWKSQNYWPMIVRGNHFAPFVSCAYYSHPCYIAYNDASRTIRGRKGFRFITIFVNTKFKNNKVAQK